MSRNSKVKRVARKKKEAKRPIRRLGVPLQPHAQLVDAEGHAVGGAGWRDNEWLTVLAGKVVARTESAAMTLAMLRHVAAVREQAGQGLTLTYSPAMGSAATREAEVAGRSLEDYLRMLEEERLERLATPGGMAPSQHRDTGSPDTVH